MKKFISQYLPFILICMSSISEAQQSYENVPRVTTPIWSANSGFTAAKDKYTLTGTQSSSVNWIKVTTSGTLLIGGHHGLIGFDPKDGRVVFDSKKSLAYSFISPFCLPILQMEDCVYSNKERVISD